MGAIFLLIAVPLLLAYLWLASRTTRWARNKYPQTKWPARLTILFWILLPTWDSILALSYHRYVCATAPDIGLTVYQTVKLDPKLFDPKTGKPMIFDKWGSFDKSIVGERFKYTLHAQFDGGWPLVTWKKPFEVWDTQTNTKLASATDYQAIGGMWWWGLLFARFGGSGIAGPMCLSPKERANQLDAVLQKPFIAH